MGKGCFTIAMLADMVRYAAEHLLYLQITGGKE